MARLKKEHAMAKPYAPQPRPKVVGYARNSPYQPFGEHLRLDRQVEKIQRYVELYDLALVDLCVDDGADPATLDRPALQAALALLTSGQAGGLVVATVDRLTPHVEQLATLVEQYFTVYHLHCVVEHITTMNPVGRERLTRMALMCREHYRAMVARYPDVEPHGIEWYCLSRRLMTGWRAVGAAPVSVPRPECPEAQQRTGAAVLVG